MRPIEPGCRALVIAGPKRPPPRVGDEVLVCHECTCWSRKAEHVCTGCKREGTVQWVVRLDAGEGARMCACECSLLRIDPGEDDVDTFTLERWRDVAERDGLERARRRLDEELERLRARQARILEGEGSQ